MPATGDLHWTPSAAFSEATELARYMRWLDSERGLHFADYDALHQWSITELGAFWESIWDFFKVESPTPRGPALVESKMPGATWFPGAQINYARRLIEAGADDDIAVEHYSEVREPGALTWGQLRRQTRDLAYTLTQLGVEPGDRVAAYLPNIPEALTGLIATTGVGALWSSCSPDFGVSSVLDRFRQIEPKVLLACDGYRYGGKDFDRRDAVRELVENLPSVEHVVSVPYLFDDPTIVPGAHATLAWDAAIAARPADAPDPLARNFPFDHPLWIVYSSGTTGLPKGMVHGHGGVLLEHLKTQALHMNHRPGSKLFFYTTTGWIMFNLLAAALISGAGIVQYDGNPAWPDLKALWRIVEGAR
ncbi:MAG: AMP-binding protein, partial [Pseudomonadota bacterium]